jgi:diacylglycerol kinase
MGHEGQRMVEERPRRRRSWPRKFRDAFRGVAVGVRGQSSFRAHFLFTVLVIAAAALLRASWIEWAVLLLCIAVVLAAEMFNSALESLAKAITGQHDPRLADALDTGSAAVLVAAIGAALVGGIVFLHRLGVLAAWWQ